MGFAKSKRLTALHGCAPGEYNAENQAAQQVIKGLHNLVSVNRLFNKLFNGQSSYRKIFNSIGRGCALGNSIGDSIPSSKLGSVLAK